MAGKYNGAQAKILEVCSLALFSPCGCHTLNLVGNDAAECLPEAVTYFGTVQTVFNVFSSSPMRWEILLEKSGHSLHRISDTRWSARIEAVKAFAQSLPGIKRALEAVLDMNLTAKARLDINGALTYVSSFVCILMSVLWFKILARVDICMKVIQARDATLDVEVKNIESLITDLKSLRDKWDQLWKEATSVASSLDVEVKLYRGRAAPSKKKEIFS